MTRTSVTAMVATLNTLAAVGMIAAVQAQGPGETWDEGELGPERRGFAELLGLSEEQRTQLKAMREKTNGTLKPLLQSARQAHQAFRETLEAEDADATAVGQAALAMHAAQKKVRAAQRATFEKMKAILTPEQREKLEQAGPRGFGPPLRAGRGRPRGDGER